MALREKIGPDGEHWREFERTPGAAIADLLIDDDKLYLQDLPLLLRLGERRFYEALEKRDRHDSDDLVFEWALEGVVRDIADFRKRVQEMENARFIREAVEETTDITMRIRHAKIAYGIDADTPSSDRDLLVALAARFGDAIMPPRKKGRPPRDPVMQEVIRIDAEAARLRLVRNGRTHLGEDAIASELLRSGAFYKREFEGQSGRDRLRHAIKELMAKPE